MKKMTNTNSHSENEEEMLREFTTNAHMCECLYRDAGKIFGETFQMCILKDFEKIAPNDLVRTLETVEGGGLVIFTIDSDSAISAFKNIINSTLDDEKDTCFGHFHKRIVMSISRNPECLVIDDRFNVLRCNTPDDRVEAVQWLNDINVELDQLKNEHQNRELFGALLKCTKTADQFKSLLICIDGFTCSRKKATVLLTGARGRGKSATLGLAVAAAVASNNHAIYVTSRTPENLCTFFKFVVEGLETLGYANNVDFALTSDQNKHVIKIEVLKDNKNHLIKYITPNQNYLLEGADLLIIDEAAALPLQLVCKLFGPYSVFLSSTVNGFEGTGRTCTLELLNHLRRANNSLKSSNMIATGDGGGAIESYDGRCFHELMLNEPIRYDSRDETEKWLGDLLCLNAMSSDHCLISLPHPDYCDLFYINREALFSHNPASEIFLSRIVSMFSASNYCYSPSDLKEMADNPHHHTFCLLSPTKSHDFEMREILVSIQICFEGNVSKISSIENSNQHNQTKDDLVSSIISNQFRNTNFDVLFGARIVKMATHHNVQNKGYGKKAIQLLREYFEYKFTDFNDNPIVKKSEKNAPVLCQKLSDRKPEELDYLCVFYSLSELLLRFWKYNDFVPLYVDENVNDISGQHLCIMVCPLRNVLDENSNDQNLRLELLWQEFRSRFLNLLPVFFKNLHPSLALKMLKSKQFDSISSYDANWSKFYTKHLKENFLTRLEDFDNNRDLVKSFAEIFFSWNLDVYIQSKGQVVNDLERAILLAVALQNKSFDETAKCFDLTYIQVKAKLRCLFQRSLKYLQPIFEVDDSHISKKSKLRQNAKKRKHCESEEPINSD